MLLHVFQQGNLDVNEGDGQIRRISSTLRMNHVTTQHYKRIKTQSNQVLLPEKIEVLQNRLCINRY